MLTCHSAYVLSVYAQSCQGQPQTLEPRVAVHGDQLQRPCALTCASVIGTADAYGLPRQITGIWAGSSPF